MKNVTKLFTALFFTTLFFSCTPQSLSENDTNDTLNISATGGDDSATVDDDRDGD